METSGYTIALPPAALDIKEPGVEVTTLPLTPPVTNNSIPVRRVSLLPPDYIATDFDALRFEAAAHTQLVYHHGHSLHPSSTTEKSRTKVVDEEPSSSDQLITSPYNKPSHYLSLTHPPLPLPSVLLALALTALQPLVPTYATTAYTSALNLDAVLGVLRALVQSEGVDWPETRFYVVVFRSKLKQNIDNDYLYKLDEESHAEACASGGLLKYWFGKSDAERRNLATCFWHSREDAYRGGLGPWHKKARAAGRELYERIDFTTHWFTVLEGVKGYRFEDYTA
ncbi:hypothetical protein yc1106_09251 [Curvularia clavata]|uniref:Uncharacterized protein n=1 Tax=Curvularia clavata TaxID=95742 RepID=A0A9Q8ZHC8_CURCL|nr:hypothetical protein yc1106_09251 [Curvularia clavata]